MSLNDIKLSPSVVIALYKSVLVQDPLEDRTTKKETKKERISEEDISVASGSKAASHETVSASAEKTVMIESISIDVEEEDPVEAASLGRKPKKKESLNRVTKALGANEKNILIVVNYNNIVFIPDEELEFLTSILKACKLSLNDVAIVNTNNNPVDGYKEYTKQFTSKIVLLFGVDPLSFGLPINFPEFQVQSLTNTVFLYSPSLSECMANKLLKSKLWVSLQRIFGL
jgi:hypothetical protein